MLIRRLVIALTLLVLIGSAATGLLAAWTPLPVADDPFLRMPGTQPNQVIIEGPNRCLNCHGGYNTAVEPAFNWTGSMMAQASRDPIFWACLTVAAQDAIAVVGNPNATDLCLRCHFPQGWLEGRSDPTNASLMTGSDFDGLHCDFCHQLWDPFAVNSYAGTRESDDWDGYWDEAGNTGPGSGTLSQTLADATYAEDLALQANITFFAGGDFFISNQPTYPAYDSAVSGQFYVSPNGEKRAGFADHQARHAVFYSRFHKSRYFCATCHDVSNPVFANLDLGLPDPPGSEDLASERFSGSYFFHVERTWSEFTLSAFGRPGGAATSAEFQLQGAPEIAWAAKCQDCHMRDVVGAGCDLKNAPIRPTESTEHPNSGMPLHDMTGGNAAISYILGTLDPSTAAYDPRNVEILDQGPAVLTLDLAAGESPTGNGPALLAGSDRAKEQLQLAATILTPQYDPVTGLLQFSVQNNTAHKLISGFPEGRRMFVNIRAYAADTLIYEVNPYDDSVGTLRGLPNAASSPALGAGEAYVDELVYEVHPSSDVTGESETFHFVLATGRYKDNRIPPRGFDSVAAVAQQCEPVVEGVSYPEYFTPEEYRRGRDDVSLMIAPEADRVEIVVYYQTTSREYIEFLRDEINGVATTLAPEAYIAQTDPFFDGLRAWGDAIWNLWHHNHGLDGLGRTVDCITPFEMTRATVLVDGGDALAAYMLVGGAGEGSSDVPMTPPTAVDSLAPGPELISAEAANREVTLTWSDLHSADRSVTGYAIYYDQAGKSQLIATVGLTTTFTDADLNNGHPYFYKVAAIRDGVASAKSNVLTATPANRGQSRR